MRGKHHHHIQLLRLSSLKDHHVILAIIGCTLLIVAFAFSAKAMKSSWNARHAQVAVSEQDGSTSDTTEKKKKKKKEKEEVVEEAIPETQARRLDGVVVPYAESNPLPLCVMIENLGYEGVRPQFGLSKAAIVYEMIVEGGITRFMAVFNGNEDTIIGPVRSARDTYLEFASEYNCPYFHAGGSFTALQALRNMHLRDVDGLIESKYFWRDTHKYAPHNFFTSVENLKKAVTNHNWFNEAAPSFTSWLFSSSIPSVATTADADTEDEEVNENTNVGVPEVINLSETMTEQASNIVIGFGGVYDVEYKYDPNRNVYVRWNGGVRQTDAANNSAELTPVNVILEHVGAGIYVEGKGRINWPVTGEGSVDIFHDGKVIKGKWKKSDRVSRTQYVTDDGKNIELSPGTTWVEIVPEHISSHYN